MTQRHGQRPSPLWPLSLRAMASSLKAVVVVSDGRQAQAGSLAWGRESACLADGQLPVLTNPGSCPRRVSTLLDGPRSCRYANELNLKSHLSSPVLSGGQKRCPGQCPSYLSGPSRSVASPAQGHMGLPPGALPVRGGSQVLIPRSGGQRSGTQDPEQNPGAYLSWSGLLWL